MSNEMDQFKDLFIMSAKEHLQELNDTLLKLESHPGELDLVEVLMRAGHSLKGESAAMGYEHTATLAHVIEDLFTGIGNGSLKITDEVMNVLFSAFDHVEESLAKIAATPDGTELDTTEFVTKLKDLTGLKTEGFGKSGQAPTPTAPSEPASSKKGKAKKKKADEQPPVAQETTPEPAAPEPAPTADASSPSAELPPEAAIAGDQISSITLKVEKLDEMIAVSEELVLLKMQLKTNPLVQGDSRLKADIHRLDRLVTDMQFYVMQARLFPISLALHTIPRLVRDTAKKTGKEVRLEIEGEETTVDRTIIDHLTEPFVHMVRNSIDHGIESPEERVRLGKPAEAVVRMKAYTKENKFYVEVEDDGRGIEWEKLGQACLDKGLISAEEMAGWTTQAQKEKLLYLDGSSASDEITDISGRGVGLSAVQKAIKKLGGTILVKTEVGIGTTFTIRLPLTLAIMRALLVKVGSQTFALPANEVIRSIQLESSQIRSSGNAAVIVVDQQEVFLMDLMAIFHVPDTEKSESTQKTVVLVHQDQQIIGCVVDKIVAEEEILVKQLGPLLKQSAHFSGATILANGTAAPIINFEGLLWKPSLS